jgi:drug/metabolite transporter (DMT)-like permease
LSPRAIRPYLWMLSGCVAFTVMNSLTHALRQNVDWQIIALFRTGLAFFFAFVLTKAAGAQLVLLRPRILWIRSLAGSVSLLCAFFALTREGPVANVLAITNIFPIWVALLGWPLLGMRPGWSVMLSIAAAVTGVFLIRSPLGADGFVLWSDDGDAGAASLFALLASFATAVAMLGLNRLAWIDTRAVVAHFSGVAMLCCAVVSIGSARTADLDALSSPNITLVLLAIGVSATAGQICLTKAFTTGEPAKVSVVGLTQIVMTLAVDVICFEEHFTLSRLAGIALVVVPTAWVIVSQQRQQTSARQFDEVVVEKESACTRLKGVQAERVHPG